ncbi:hypothetical protein PVAR5_3624 [Paecilomyces variotii No. 5]|uniref:Uncharacterized protein n=1 Tax=Byssochlamys spectabilis (strain No. 5 / NBRC 109023) TaxID=1356009 RepID=V5HYE4_BYSSN|nr:hypothetical protein PVAR5_3624 [Paecilomyces variotii No. 5]
MDRPLSLSELRAWPRGLRCATAVSILGVPASWRWLAAMIPQATRPFTAAGWANQRLSSAAGPTVHVSAEKHEAWQSRRSFRGQHSQHQYSRQGQALSNVDGYGSVERSTSVSVFSVRFIQLPALRNGHCSTVETAKQLVSF